MDTDVKFSQITEEDTWGVDDWKTKSVILTIEKQTSKDQSRSHIFHLNSHSATELLNTIQKGFDLGMFKTDTPSWTKL